MNERNELEEVLKALHTMGVSTGEIEPDKNEYEISLPLHKKIDDGSEYETFLVSDNGKFYFTDKGATFKELDKIFELKEPDVIKNLVAIMKHYGCRPKKNPKVDAVISSESEVIIDCTPQNVHLKLGHFIQVRSFMLNMKIFYV